MGVDKDTIEITARESYLIMDAISYVLDMLPNHDDYSREELTEELTKCAQKFGDLNLKNKW